MNQDSSSAKPRGKTGLDVLFVVGLLAGWFVLQAWVLPGLGVST